MFQAINERRITLTSERHLTGRSAASVDQGALASDRTRSRLTSTLLGLALVVALAPVSLAQEEPEPTPPPMPMDWLGVDLEVVLQAVAEETQKRFLYPGSGGGGQAGGLTGAKIWFRCPVPIPHHRIYEVFEAMMELHNFALIETGSPDSRIVKVVNKQGAPIKAVDYVTADELYDLRVEDRYVTFAYNFKYISDGLRVQQQLRTIAPAATDGLMILGVQSLPFIIISGFAPTVYRLYRILEQMDVPPEEDRIEVVPVMFALASEIKTLMDPFLQQRAGALAQQQAAAYVIKDQAIVQADERTNSLIIQGSDEAIQEIIEILIILDTQVAETTRFHIVKLRHSNAEEMATTLTSVIQGIQGGTRRGARGGAAPGGGGVPPPGAIPAGAGTLVGDISITHDVASNSLIVIALERDYEQVKTMVETLDRRKPQVYIEAAYVEISSTKNLAHAVELAGIDLAEEMGLRVAGATFFSSDSGPFSALVDDMGQPLTGGGVPAGRFPIPPSNGALITVFNNDIFSIPLMLRALATQSDVEVLATPRILANDNEEARISLRDEEPTASINTTDTGVTSQTFAGTEDAITELVITPHISSEHELRLEIHQTIEEFGERPIAGLPPAKISREIQTQVTVPDRHTIVLGGLRGKASRSTVTKVPLLGDIPLLGTLFQFREVQEATRDIYIFLTPRILTDVDFGDLLDVSQEHKEELEGEADFDTVEVIDPNYRRGLSLGNGVRPTSYFQPRRPGEAPQDGAAHSGASPGLVPLYPPSMDSSGQPADPGMPRVETYDPPPVEQR